MNRRDFSGALLASAAAVQFTMATQPAAAQGALPVEGRDFTRLGTPQTTAAAGKVEVIEFFSYACPHCSAFEPLLEDWAKTLPADVVLRRVPVPFLPNFRNFQATYYALESLGLVDKMQSKVFAAVHVEHQHLEKPEDVAALVAKNGGDAKAFLAAFNSFSVANAVTRAKKTAADYGIDSVPALSIQGRFLTSPSQAGSGPQTLTVANALIQRARKG